MWSQCDGAAIERFAELRRSRSLNRKKRRDTPQQLRYLLKPDGGLDILGKADDPEASPNSGQIEQRRTDETWRFQDGM